MAVAGEHASPKHGGVRGQATNKNRIGGCGAERWMIPGSMRRVVDSPLLRLRAISVGSGGEIVETCVANCAVDALDARRGEEGLKAGC
jgi:hypothetical protein